MSAWREIARRAGEAELAAIDLELAGLLHRLAGPAHREEVAAAAALAGRLHREGHSCLRLAEWGGRPFAGITGMPEMPEAAAWAAALRGEKELVGDGSRPTALVLDGRGRLYHHRYWRAEGALAERIRARLGENPLGLDRERLHRELSRLFAGAPEQEEAARRSLRSGFALITGGPGTGKTTTIFKLLAAVREQAPDLEVALAAPTGKAAARISESIRAQQEGGGGGNLPPARTLHRLLGYRPLEDTFAHGPERPLPAGVVILDEASMVDLLLMERLFAALHPRALVVLLGDKDQLASVATGYVLGDMVEAAAEAEAPAALQEAVSGLERCYRYREGSGLQELVGALRAKEPGRALAVLADEGFPALSLRPRPPGADGAAALLDPQLRICARAGGREEMERAFAAARLLTPHRRGPLGVERLNRAVEARLRALGMATGEPFYRGRPVLVTANDYETGLFNGDTGIAWPDEEGRTQVWFPAPDGGSRPVHPLRLPAHETGWALTVHKSQGSEYEKVILVLPRADSPLATRELVYTGISRARREVVLLGEAAELEQAVTRSTIRPSGLKEKLLAR